MSEKRQVFNGVEDLPYFEKPIQKYPRWNILEDTVLLNNAEKMTMRELVKKINTMFKTGRTIAGSYRRLYCLRKKGKGNGGGDVSSKRP